MVVLSRHLIIIYYPLLILVTLFKYLGGRGWLAHLQAGRSLHQHIQGPIRNNAACLGCPQHVCQTSTYSATGSSMLTRGLCYCLVVSTGLLLRNRLTGTSSNNCGLSLRQSASPHSSQTIGCGDLVMSCVWGRSTRQFISFARCWGSTMGGI